MTDDEGESAKSQLIAALARRIDREPEWWRFPDEGLVRGFLGTAPLFIVGDQPSTSSWPPSNPNRRAFYDLLLRLGVHGAHLTDLYKRRGLSNSLKKVLPPDFQQHVAIFREELAILTPSRVVALGELCFNLLTTHIPEVRPLLRKTWHFGYAQRYGRVEEWETNIREAIWGTTASAPGNAQQQRFTENTRRVPSSDQCAAEYEFSRLCFRADVIEPLAMDEQFCVVTPVGTFRMTKRQFYEVFRNVLASESYRKKGNYHYPSVPAKALPFKVR